MQFQEVRRGALVYTMVPEIPVPHAFTTRLGGVDTGSHASLNLGYTRTADKHAVLENYRILCSALGLNENKIVCRRQVHGTRVDAVTSRDLIPWDEPSPEGDGLMTDEKGLALLVFTADCVPLLLYDPVSGAVAALHAGWRGTVDGMAEEGVRAMVKAYGCDPKNLLAAIGPSIGPCCFEAGEEVKEAALHRLGAAAEALISPLPFGPGADSGYQAKEGKCFIDLKAFNRALFLRAGIPAENIAVSNDCARCNVDRYWSYRFHGNARGSQGLLVSPRG